MCCIYRYIAYFSSCLSPFRNASSASFLPVLFPYILWLLRASWKCYQFFTIYINTEIFLRSSVSFMSPRCPFPAQLHLQLRIVNLLLGTGLRILIFDKRTGNLSPVSVRRGAARLPPQLVGWPSAKWSTATETEAATATKAAMAAAQSQRESLGTRVRALREFWELVETSCSAQISTLS